MGEGTSSHSAWSHHTCSPCTHTHKHSSLNYMREKFISRLVTIKPDWSLFNDELTDKQLEGEVYAAASTILDCEANFPGDFEQVLQTILKQLTVGSRDRMSLRNDARHLFENSDQCSLTISKSNVDDTRLV